MFNAFYDVDRKKWNILSLYLLQYGMLNGKTSLVKKKNNLKSSQNTLPKMCNLDYFTNYSLHHVICNQTTIYK